MSAYIEQSHKVFYICSRDRAGKISGEDNSIVPPCNLSRCGLTHLLLAKSIMGWRKWRIQGDSQVQSVKISDLVPPRNPQQLWAPICPWGRIKCMLIKSLETGIESAPPCKNPNCFSEFQCLWIIFPNETLIWTGKRNKGKCWILGSGAGMDRSVDDSPQHRVQQQGARFLGSRRAHCKYLELEGKH